MILLIGATSFLGPSVLKQLLISGKEVRCLTRTGNKSKKIDQISREPGTKVSFASGNLLSPDSMMDAFGGISGIIYMVDLVKTDLLENFLSAVSRTRIKRAVFISSTTVLLPTQSRLKDRKLQSEELIKKSGLDYTILRPTMIYGVPDDPNFSKMLEFIKKKGFFIIFGKGDNLIQPVFIDDVARAVADVLGNKVTYKKTYELAGKEPLEYKEMLETTKQALGMKFKVFRIPLIPAKLFLSVFGGLSKKLSLAPGQIEGMRINKSYSYKEAEDDFGFSPISFEEGIKKLINSMKELF